MNEIIENKKKSEILAEHISYMKYGEVITHKDISEIIQEPYPGPKYSSTISKTKKVLLNDYGKIIENIVGDGYRVVRPGGYTDQALKKFKEGFKRVQNGTEILQKAPKKDMTAEELSTHREIEDRASILTAHIAGAVTEIKMLRTRKHPLQINNKGE